MIVLDTHILIWDVLNPKKIPSKISLEIDQADNRNELLIADISLWEIAMLIEKKRLEISVDASSFISALLKLRNFEILPIDYRIAAKSVELAEIIGSDPADSLIAATAQTRNATLITADRKIIASNTVNTLWKSHDSS